ncbi:MAG: hypothetical protein ONB48_15455 [candidate division KSB1 bacterium]|nr:hypothetical protein [candidate division KSB1 bacterium]MDZ7276178.1 hypothetical protein [candidate division KSB1 bacterium]MDZ7287042.1 hypothetical protein [candidate division KSB1 bacterium]MDZ7297033.1 hypothetical protein [candidate division KSB1 bacterium]MDZ7309368.1 hypothetical protein [candidate division KSB1 bacterium]
MMHQIAQALPECDVWYTPYYGDPLIEKLAHHGWLEFSVLGGKHRARATAYLQHHGLRLDPGGVAHDYDLVVTCSDLIIPKNVRRRKIVLVQEGMTDPENFMFHLVKHLRLPRYLASTSTTGLSGLYEKFCVASEGYRQLFIRKGVPPDRLVVTGIPNFDNAAQYRHNDFPHRHFVLVATSDTRETFKFDNRKRFLQRACAIAAGRPMIFKLHPNEIFARAAREIRACVPEATIYQEGNVHHMIANCDVLITQYSSVVYTGLALQKEVHSCFDLEQLRALAPIQNGGTSAHNIAAVCRELLSRPAVMVPSAWPGRPPLAPDRRKAFAA